MKRILIQLDTDTHPSVFDRVVAHDAGADEVFAYGGVRTEDVEGLVHGGMFTRSVKKLRKTAVFVGGSDIKAGQELYDRVLKTYFGPMQLSTMIDCNGANTTAAAAVLSAIRHGDLRGRTVLVLGGTGPVGQRIGELVARSGGLVRIASRDIQRANECAARLSAQTDTSSILGVELSSPEGKSAALKDVDVIFAAGAAGVQFLTRQEWGELDRLRVAIDVNAVPPVGLEGIEITDEGVDREEVLCYGALGVGGLKMKIHKAAIEQLFESNDQKFDTLAIYELGKKLVG